MRFVQKKLKPSKIRVLGSKSTWLRLTIYLASMYPGNIKPHSCLKMQPNRIKGTDDNHTAPIFCKLDNQSCRKLEVSQK